MCDWVMDTEGTRRPCSNSGGQKLGDRAFCIAHFRKMQAAIEWQIEADPRFRDRLIAEMRRSDLEEAQMWTQYRKGIESWPDGPLRAHAVYFFEREGFCKIGRTSNIETRAKSIARGSCMPDGMTVGPVRTLAVIYCNCLSLCVREKFFHKKFRHLHYQLEWFLLDAELRNFIGGLDGCLDDGLREASFPGK